MTTCQLASSAYRKHRDADMLLQGALGLLAFC